MSPRSLGAGKAARAALLFAGIAAAATIGVIAWRYAREELAIRALRSLQVESRAEAARMLADWGAVRAIPALLDCERRPDPAEDLRRIALGYNSWEPSYAFEALDRLAGPSAAPCLLRLLESPHPVDRAWAARALGRIRSPGEAAFEGLSRLLQDSHPEVVESAAISLVRFGSKAAPLIALALESPGRAGSESLWHTLVQLGPLVHGVAPRMVSRLLMGSDDHLEFRKGFAEYLEPHIWKMAGAELEKRLHAASPEERARLADCLSSWRISISPTEATQEIVPALRVVGESPEKELREAASETIEWARSYRGLNDLEGDPDPRTKLLEDLAALRGANIEAHESAASRLVFFEPGSGDKALLGSFLAPYLSDPSPAVRAAAAWCLGKVGTGARDAAPRLKAVLNDPHLAVRIFAADALCALAMEPEIARKTLDAGLPRALCSSNSLLLERAVSGLVRLQINDAVGLRRLLQDPSEDVSRAAWHAMHELGPEAAPALPLLGELWESDSKGAVLSVIHSMGPAAVSFAARIESLAATQSSWERLLTLRVLNAVAPGPKCAALLAEIFSEAKDTGYLREASADELLERAEHALAEIPRFLRHLRENDGAIFASAILSHIGAPAAPALIEALQGADADLRAWAAWTLGGMALVPAEAKPALSRALEDPSALVRSAALQALERAASGDKPLPPRDWPRGVRFECGNAQSKRVEEFHLALCGDHAEAGKKGALGQQ